jgi:hypothetical protein
VLSPKLRLHLHPSWLGRAYSGCPHPLPSSAQESGEGDCAYIRRRGRGVMTRLRLIPLAIALVVLLPVLAVANAMADIIDNEDVA